MKSQLPEQWPLDSRDLSAADRDDLERELSNSPELQQAQDAWQAIESSFQEAPMASPEPGFTDRWRWRVAGRRARKRQRQVRWVLGALMMGAFTAMMLIGIDTLASPAQFGTALIEAIIRVGQLVDTGTRYFTLLGDGWPALVGTLAFSIALAWLIVLWTAAMYRYAFGRVQNGER